jgi:cystathionine gamma-synthase
MSRPFSGTTRAVRAALESDTQHGAVIPPIHLTSTFAFESFGEKRTYDYTPKHSPSSKAARARSSRLPACRPSIW